MSKITDLAIHSITTSVFKYDCTQAASCVVLEYAPIEMRPTVNADVVYGDNLMEKQR